jgi:hypothetical protein
MSNTVASQEGMQSQLNALIYQFENQNEVNSTLLGQLIELKNQLVGTINEISDKKVDKIPLQGITPRIAECLRVHDHHIKVFEETLKALAEYI